MSARWSPVAEPPAPTVERAEPLPTVEPPEPTVEAEPKPEPAAEPPMPSVVLDEPLPAVEPPTPMVEAELGLRLPVPAAEPPVPTGAGRAASASVSCSDGSPVARPRAKADWPRERNHPDQPRREESIAIRQAIPRHSTSYLNSGILRGVKGNTKSDMPSRTVRAAGACGDTQCDPHNRRNALPPSPFKLL
jgi:hypothetical protein